MCDRTTRRQGVCGVILFAVVLAVTLASAPAEAQEHDLVMYGLSADPNPLERGCSATLHASFLINGSEDHQLHSGDAQIQLSWADGANPIPSDPSGWTPAGSVTVTWSPSDGPFAEGREWPTDFPSVAGTGVSWTVPEGPTSFHLRAEVRYLPASGESDDLPVDNELVAADVPSVAGSCPSFKRCFVSASGVVLCPPWELDIPDLRCLINPDCFELAVPLCSVVPCIRCLSCPPEGWEIFVDRPIEELFLEVLDPRGEVIARSEPAERWLQDERFEARQVLYFRAEEGVDYQLRMMAGEEVRPGQELRFDLEMRALGEDNY